MTLVSPPRFLINVETKKTLDVLRYLCRGPINMQVASIESVTLYAEELQSYGDVYFYVIDVICGILLWRGRARFGYNGLVLNFWFPIHSIFIFIMANMIVEQPRYLVPIISFSITWFLVSLNLYNSSLPSPWKRCKVRMAETLLECMRRHDTVAIHTHTHINFFLNTHFHSNLYSHLANSTGRWCWVIAAMVPSTSSLANPRRKRYFGTNSTKSRPIA